MTLLNSTPAISFPGLGIDLIDPPRTLPFTVFGKEIYLYGVVIALGFLLAIFYVRRRVKEFGTNFDLVTDAILITVPIAIVCARVYYVIFSWDVYRDNPISALYIWEGGLAIYGGVIGAILGLILFAKFRKQKLTPYLDMMSLGLLIGQSVGRWGNFFNREAYGAEITNSFFLRMGLIDKTTGLVRYWHPTFLYESIWCFLLFLLLLFVDNHRKFEGQVAITITGIDDRTSKITEPGAPLPEARFRALRELTEAGVNTYALIAPILGHLEGHEREFCDRIIDTGVKRAALDPLNLRPQMSVRLERMGIRGSAPALANIRRMLREGGVEVRDVFQA